MMCNFITSLCDVQKIYNFYETSDSKKNAPQALTMTKEEAVHMPEWPKWLEAPNPNMNNEENFSEFSVTQKEQLSKILSYLAIENPTLYSAKMRRFEPKAPNACCNRVSKVYFDMICNPKQIFLDNACCFCVSCSDPKPNKMTWVAPSLFDKMNEMRRDTNRNNFFILVVTPGFTVSLPFVPAPTLVLIAFGIGIALLGLHATGVNTFTFFDTSGEAAAFAANKQGFEELSKYVYEAWQSAKGEEKEKMAKQILQINQNFPNLIQSMKNIDMKPEFIEASLTPFQRTIKKIVCEIRQNNSKNNG